MHLINSYAVKGNVYTVTIDSGAVQFIKKSLLDIDCFVCSRLSHEALVLANAVGRQLHNSI